MRRDVETIPPAHPRFAPLRERLLRSHLLVALLGLLLQAAPLQAQATRTWVSGVGDESAHAIEKP